MRSGCLRAKRTGRRATADALPAGQSRIFISYRREDTAYAAGWLFDRLAERFGRDQIFKDVDSIELGDDFVEVITKAVGATDVLLALIGDQWLTIVDERGRPRLENPEDFVRLEIEAACARKVRLIPILVAGAKMPTEDELPPTLAPIARRQALELSPSRFEFDTSLLIRELEQTLAEGEAAQADAASAAAPSVTPKDSSTTDVRRTAHDHGSRGRTVGATTHGPAWPGWRKRLLARPRILIGTGAAIAAAVLALVIAAITTNSDSNTNTKSSTSSSSPGGDQGATGASFQDDFSNGTFGWQATSGSPPAAAAGGANDARDRYTTGAFRVSAEPVSGGRFVWYLPQRASSVYPFAPPNVDVSVVARKLAGSGEDIRYGIACRAKDDKAYVFTLSATGDFAQIAKVFPKPPYIKSPEAWTKPTSVAPENVNRMRAVCTSTFTEEGKSVHLQFFVNGEMVNEAVDGAKLFGAGSVGLVVKTGGDAIDTEFDDFVVRQTNPP